ncbi:WXG100 family type VII secretion target [Sciscionella marina]|uniref:WXG100 family type VII secretion target n=1 Tax=Sciscionella marina TaxID=508770 RepID=UPI0003793DEC|nr:WXG100 family type VII secretion target [Sciscionella marina]
MSAPTQITNDVQQTTNQAQQARGEADSVANESSGESSWDPLNTLINKGLGFLIDHIQPLKEALEMVTGSPDALNTGAQNYLNLQQEINAIGKDLEQQFKSGSQGWEGKASEAAKKEMDGLVEGVKGTGELASAISDLLKSSGEMMKAAKDTIISIIADFVETAITNAAAYGWVPVAGQAALVTRLGVKIAECVGKAVKFVSKVGKIIMKIGRVLESAARVLGRIGRILEKIGKFATKGGLKLNRAARTLGRRGENIAQRVGRSGLSGEARSEAEHSVSRSYDNARFGREGEQEQGPESPWKSVREDAKEGIKSGYESYQDADDAYERGKEQDGDKIDQQITGHSGSYADDADQQGTVDGQDVNQRA